MPEHGSQKQPPEDANPLVAAVAHDLHLGDEPGGRGGGGAPPERPGGGPPRDPGSRLSGIVAWIVLVAAVAFTVSVQWGRGAPIEEGAAAEVQSPGGLMVLGGRYAVGADAFGLEMDEALSRQLIGQLDAFASTPADELRIAIVEAQTLGREPALERLAALEESLRAEAEDAEAPAPAEETLLADLEAVRALISGSDVAPADPDGLRERHGFFGQLALALGLPEESPARAAVRAKGQRTVLVAIVGITGFGAVCLAGLALGIVALVMLARGRIRPAYAPPSPGGSVYLEIFVIFVLGFLVVAGAAQAIAQQSSVDLSRVLIWLLLLVPFWALVRGAPLRNFRYAMGWHRGRGFVREIGAGVVGYVACLPVFLLGILLTLLLGAVMGALAGPGEEAAPPSHPIIDLVDPSNLWSVLGIYMVAAVWAPIVEESIFRGALYHHLRGRLAPLGAALVVAFLFAVIHPQGIIAVPALMSLAVVFALLREWRGSLIAPITAHAVHNGALMTGLILALS